MLRLQNIFNRWIDKNDDYLKACRGKMLAVTYSGGKDSSAALYLLNRAKEKYEYHMEAFLYAFPVHRYSKEELTQLEGYWRKNSVSVNSYFPDVDDSILKGVANPCRVCQDLRKKQLLILFDMYKERIEDLVIVSGHSLWDLAGYAINRLVASELAVDKDSAVSLESASKERFLEISQRFYPFFKMPNSYYVYRPMLFLNKEEIELILKEENIPILSTSCIYSDFRPKKVLGRYFEEFGYNFSYESVFSFAKNRLNIPDISEFQKLSGKDFLKTKI